MKTLSDTISNLSQSITAKIITIVILILLLLVPITWVKSLIREREMYSNEVKLEISDKWGHAQTIRGPVLTVPYYKLVEIEENYTNPTTQKTEKVKRIRKVKETAYFLPETLDVGGEVLPEIRSRGIYKVIVYSSDVEIKGQFQKPDFEKLKLGDDIEIIWKEAAVSIGIPDMRGIRNNINLKWNNDIFATEPGSRADAIIKSGVSTQVKLDDEQKGNYAFSFHLKLNGSGELYFSPLGKTTEVSLQSKWSSPKFTGAFLPEPRNVNDEGFTASWKVLHVNRNFPQQWINNQYSTQGSEFGVELLLPVDQYQKTMRSVKYAIMFIALTFMVFLFIEILNKKRIHPIQYILVSLGIVLFYSLLTSLSEQISFGVSYCISATAIIALITTYIHLIFKQAKITLTLLSLLIVLYVFLFTLLQLQDYALLLGNIGLFIALAVIMFSSRKIDWYAKIGKAENGKTDN